MTLTTTHSRIIQRRTHPTLAHTALHRKIGLRPHYILGFSNRVVHRRDCNTGHFLHLQNKAHLAHIGTGICAQQFYVFFNFPV